MDPAGNIFVSDGYKNQSVAKPDPHGGWITRIGKGNFARQAAQVFENLAIALQSAGCTAANLIKLTVFLGILAFDATRLCARRGARSQGSRGDR